MKVTETGLHLGGVVGPMRNLQLSKFWCLLYIHEHISGLAIVVHFFMQADIC